MNLLSALLTALCIAGLPYLPAGAADSETSLHDAVVAGDFSIKSIDEQTIPANLKDKLRTQSRMMGQYKVLPVSDSEVSDIAAVEAEHRARGKQLDQIVSERMTTFRPAGVEATSLSAQPMSGGLTHGIQVGQSWTGLTRIFSHPQLVKVVLEETDLAANGGGVVFTKEFINADVNGTPAMLVSKQGGEHMTMTSLTWYAKGMLYSLGTRGVDDASREELLQIARNLAN